MRRLSQVNARVSTWRDLEARVRDLLGLVELAEAEGDEATAADIERMAKLGVIASMQPPHAVEDKAWAEDRLGPERVKGAYAWRSLRRAGARLVFNSDLVGSDHDIFYGLHAALTRRDRDLRPPEGWHPAERLTPEEAVRVSRSDMAEA